MVAPPRDMFYLLKRSFSFPVLPKRFLRGGHKIVGHSVFFLLLSLYDIKHLEATVVVDLTPHK